MMTLQFGARGDRLSVLCLGAHSDDIEIGAGGTLLTWLRQGRKLEIFWSVLSADDAREDEARASARDFLEGAARVDVEVMKFKTSFFPSQENEIKTWFESLKSRVNPDVILTHRRDDFHQDHREVSRHTWATFRDHLILEYEIPKWDGDLGRPNLYVPVAADVLQRKIDLLIAHFGTQRSKDWFDQETFRALARLRGMECRAPECFAEGFFAPKLALG
jgi:LmbE family N-acetylglucosaminyl deacetylase